MLIPAFKLELALTLLTMPTLLASIASQEGNCQTPDLGLGLGVDFTFANNNNNNKNNNPHQIFHRREGTRGLKFGAQTKGRGQ